MTAQTVPRDSIVIGERARHGVGDISGLVASIAAVGLLQPIGVTSDFVLVFGRRRLAALDELGVRDIPVVTLDETVDVVDALRAELDENVERCGFSPSEAAALRARIKRLTADRRRAAAAAAREQRRDATGTLRPADDANLPHAVPSAGELDRALADATGVSISTMQRVERIAAVAEGTSPAAPVAAAALDSIDGGAPVKPQLDAVLAVNRWPELATLASKEPARAVSMASYLDSVVESDGTDAVEAELAALTATLGGAADSDATRAAVQAFELTGAIERALAELERHDFETTLGAAKPVMLPAAAHTWELFAHRIDKVVASIRAGLNRTGGDDD